MTTRVPFNDLGRALQTQADLLRAAFEDVVASGWLVHGPHHRAFEGELAAYLGVPEVLGVASGTDALALALRAAQQVRPGQVVTAANAGGYTSVAARLVGASVHYCDVDPETHVLDGGALAELLDEISGDEVSAVVVTHLYGHQAELPEIADLCRERGILLVEDCAQAVGARRDGVAAGATGDLATFSFYPTKNLGALGDGGAVATRSAELAERVRQLRQYGWGTKYDVRLDLGTNSRLDEVQAALLRVRLPMLDGFNERRRAVIGRYSAAAPDGVRLLPADGEWHSAHLAVVETADAAGLRRHLDAHGVGTDVHYPVPDHRQPAWAQPAVHLPVTDGLVGRILSLPCFPELRDDEVDAVCRALGSYEG
ncbi:DegT/DnrJ/EryC1/StrS family aminotransferase [Nocardioides bigeumensis]|uniref:DegT/DnrJ/EryC1/StrS family aminotransferase n=1 Tax=Nocardioides bigeumensis TaxID=433657 RepID=A0ABP5K4M9_9ACTN